MPRPKGSQNKITAEVKEQLQKLAIYSVDCISTVQYRYKLHLTY